MKPDANVAFVMELADSVLRNWWTVVAGLCLGIASSMLALHFLPKTYEASTKIFVARQMLPEDFVRPTVTDDMKMRMAALKEAVLSRPYMQKIIEDTYAPAPQGRELEEMINNLRLKVDVSVVKSVFNITFRDADPQRAANVANALAQLYIDENFRFRATRAGEATATLEDLAAGVLADLSAKEQAITEYKAQHPYETEENRLSNLRMRELRQRDLETNQAALKYQEQKLEDLQTQLTRAQSGGGLPDATLTEDPYTTTLGRLQQELRDLRANYLDSHPAVKTKLREIEEFKRNSHPEEGSTENATVSPALDRLRTQIRDGERELERLKDQRTKINNEIERYDRWIEATPIVEAKLADLTKGLGVLKERYQDYQRKAEAAKGAQRLEEGRKGEQFEVIEKAVPSSIPVEPVPTVIVGLGVGAGLLLLVGPLLLVNVLRQVIGSQATLEQLADVPILVSIPALPTEPVLRSLRHRKSANFGLSFVSLAVLVSVTLFVFQVTG